MKKTFAWVFAAGIAGATLLAPMAQADPGPYVHCGPISSGRNLTLFGARVTQQVCTDDAGNRRTCTQIENAAPFCVDGPPVNSPMVPDGPDSLGRP